MDDFVNTGGLFYTLFKKRQRHMLTCCLIKVKSSFIFSKVSKNHFNSRLASNVEMPYIRLI